MQPESNSRKTYIAFSVKLDRAMIKFARVKKHLQVQRMNVNNELYNIHMLIVRSIR